MTEVSEELVMIKVLEDDIEVSHRATAMTYQFREELFLKRGTR